MNAQAITRISITAVGILAVAACYDDPLAVDVPLEGDQASEESLTAAQDSRGTASQSAVIIDPFQTRLSLDFVAETALSPGTAIVVRLNGTANEAITGGEIIVTMPTQAGMAHVAAGKRPAFPANTSLPTAARWELPAMSAGDSWSRTVTVGTLAAGAYNLAVEVNADGPATKLGPYLVDDDYREAWMLVATGGGSLTRLFDKDSFADSIAPIPGPFRKKPSFNASSGTASDADQSADSDDDPIYLNVTYLNVTYRAAEGSYIFGNMISATDPDDTYPVQSQSHIVPSSGIVAFPCPNSNLYWTGAASLPSTAEVNGAGFVGYWEATHADCGDTLLIQGTRTTYMPWDNLKEAIDLIDAHFGHNRSRIAWVTDLDANSSSYSPSRDRITFGPTYHYAWTAAHEYTHALQKEALGGLLDSTPNCNPHYVDEPSSYGCAFQEGLADYGGNVGAPHNWLHGGWEGFHKSVSGGDYEGEVEGNVAALFHDLIDSVNETNDETDYGGYDVIRAYKTCRVRDGSWKLRRQIADFVWCLENRVNEGVHNQNFVGIDVPSDVSVTRPSNWNADDIRSTWLKNVGS